MEVNILTPNIGGPHTWGKDLMQMLNKKGIRANQLSNLKIYNIFFNSHYQNADIIHTTTKHCIFCKKPLVLTIKADYTIESLVNRPLYKMSIKRADAITTPSRFIKEKLGLDDVIIIPNAVFPEKFSTAIHEEKDTLNIITVTNFNFPKKAEGIFNIINTLQEIQKSSSKDINYTVVGAGTYLEKIKRHVKNGDLKINFVGFVQEPKKLMENSDIFLYYSNHDNFPNVILEAMASGLPVITNNIGAVPEMICGGEDGYVADNDADYTKYLMDLLENYQLRGKIGQNARKTVEKKFNWNNMVNRYISIYKKCLGTL